MDKLESIELADNIKTLRRRYANRHKIKKPDSNLIYIVKYISDENFKGDVCYYNFKDADIKIIISDDKIIIDNNYKLLEFYDYTSKVKLSAFYNNNNEIIEWYFDIAKEIGKENEVPYEDDLYLDVVVKSNGEIILLDEDELKYALNNSIITKEEYEMAYREAKNLIKLLNYKKEELWKFTNKYLYFFEQI